MAELDPRKQLILRAIVIEYVEAGEPIASDALAQKYSLGVRGATIRNEMAEMSDLGFLEQPHTSAGRVPSDIGYRYYVDRLIETKSVEEPAKKKLQTGLAEGDALNEMLRSTAQALSRLTHLLTVATTTKASSITVKSAVFSALGPVQAILVIVLSNGHVENKILECPPGLNLVDVGVINDQLQKFIIGMTVRTLARCKPNSFGLSQVIDKTIGIVWNNLRTIGKDLIRGTVITEGAEFIFTQPEFRGDIESMNSLLDYLTQSDILYDAISSEPIRSITIGSENKQEGLKKLSVVRKAFFVGGNEAGMIALIGPTRMKYDSSIPLVNFTAQALTESLTKFFS